MTLEETIRNIAQLYNADVSDIDIYEYSPGNFSGTCTINGKKDCWLPAWRSRVLSKDAESMFHNLFSKFRRAT